MNKRYSFILLSLLFCSYLFAQKEIPMSLDGNWEIIFDNQNLGRNGEWQIDSIFNSQLKRTITVPSCWEEIEKDYEGVAFYRHQFDVPANWKGKVIRLHFDAVNYLAEVWLNNEVVGFHEGGFTPFEFRVDKMIKTGQTNVLTLRVVGPIILSDKEVDGVKALETPQWRGGITGGIWQSVKLMATGDIHVDNVFIEPKISDNTATLNVVVDHSAIKVTSAEIQIEIKEVGNNSKSVANQIQSWKLHPGKNKQSWTIAIPDAKYWSPDKPQLYNAKVSVLNNGEVSDEWSENFGMRELTIKDKDFYLNGKRIFIKATFFEGLYPNGIANPDNEEMARKEIRLAKEAGFNMIRPWRRPPAPMWLDLADEMGVLVVGSPVLECMGLPLSSPYLPARVENEITQTILRDRNRACVVQWELFNELHRPILKQMMRPMALMARDLDPTRLILDESGGWAFGANMYLPNDFEPTRFNDIHDYPGPFINNSFYDGFLSVGMTKEQKKAAGYTAPTPGRNVVPGLMSFVSELGYGSLPDLTKVNEHFEKEGNPLTPAFRYHQRLAEGQKEIMKESGFAGLYPDMEQFYLDQQQIHGTANKRMIEGVRSNPEIDGYCIHALVAGDWILGAGLLDIWRNPKTYAYQGTKAANQPQIVTIRTFPRNVYAEKGMTLELTGINELETQPAQLQLEITSEKGEVVFFRRLDVSWKQGVSQLLKEKMQTGQWQGNYTVNITIHAKDNAVITRNSFGFTVFQASELQAPQTTVAVLDTKNSLTDFLIKKGIKVNEFGKNTDIKTPVYVTGTKEKNALNNVQTQRLEEFMKSGGTVVYIEGVGGSKITIHPEDSMFPFTARVWPARGLWTCIPHLVHRHPIFEGLPSDCMMRDMYENVWATTTLRNIDPQSKGNIETVVGVVAYDWFSEENKMHYSGPGESWWGSDLAIVPFGKGRCIVSQLRLINNLGSDPVADKILFNLIRYVSHDKAKK